MPRSALASNPRKATQHTSPTSRQNQQATAVDTLMLHTRSPLSESFRPGGETLVLGLATALVNLGSVLASLSENAAAQESYLGALSILTDLADSHPTVSRPQMAAVLNGLGGIYFA